MSGVRKIVLEAIELAAASRPLDARLVVPGTTDETPVAGPVDTYKQAYLEGFEAGEEDGRKEALRQASASLKQLEVALAEAENAKSLWRDGLREALDQFARASLEQCEAVERLAADVAEIAVRRIVGRLHAERRAVEAACHETLQALRIEAAQVRVCPSDREAFTGLPAGIELVADASLQPGDCLVRSPQGDIEAGLTTQLALFRETLAAAVSESDA